MKQLIFNIELFEKYKKDLFEIKYFLYKKDDVGRLNRLLLQSYKRPSRTGGNYCKPFSPTDKRQFCISKLRYSKKMGGHKKFITTYLLQENKEEVKIKPILFGTALENYKKNMTDKHFKLIISPDNQRVDLKVLTEELVKRIEEQTGYSFYYLAAVHTDTNHIHSHLLINGKDKKGRDVRFKSSFIFNTIREISRDICTEIVGERTSEEIIQAKKRIFFQKRYTVLDKQIAEQIFEQDFNGKKYQTIKPNNQNLIKRLIHLTELNFAERLDSKTWKLDQGWEEDLKSIGRYNTFLQERNSRKGLMETKLYTHKDGKIKGKVVKVINMDDEEVWNNAVVVEDKINNQCWYVPLYYPTSQKLKDKEVNINVEKKQRGLLTPTITVIRKSSMPRYKLKHEKERDNNKDEIKR